MITLPLSKAHQPSSTCTPTLRRAWAAPRAGKCRRALFGAAHQLDARLGGLHQAAIGGEIVERHAARGESRLELFPDRMSAQGGKAIDRGDRADFILHDETGQPIVDDLRNRTAVVG